MKIVQPLALVALLAAATVPASIACMTTTSPSTQIDDKGIKTSVKAKLASDVRFSTLTNIEVNSTNGIVTLAGQVSSETDRLAAADVARTVKGVVRVNNDLQVSARAR